MTPTISGSSTVLALISIIHKWLKTTDGNGAAVRVLLFDYRKAFDLIDHKILVNKLKQVDVPNSVIRKISKSQTWKGLPLRVGHSAVWSATGDKVGSLAFSVDHE